MPVVSPKGSLIMFYSPARLLFQHPGFSLLDNLNR
jgi:hypothetical protein